MLVSDPDLCCLTFTKDVKKVQPSSYPSTLGTFEIVQSDCDYYLKEIFAIINYCDQGINKKCLMEKKAEFIFAIPMF